MAETRHNLLEKWRKPKESVLADMNKELTFHPKINVWLCVNKLIHNIVGNEDNKHKYFREFNLASSFQYPCSS
jgi:hypothetical protein